MDDFYVFLGDSTVQQGFFWYRTELALEVVNADVPWANARVAVVTQVGAWYNVCSVTKEDYCPRKDRTRCSPFGLLRGILDLCGAETNPFIVDFPIKNGDFP